MDGRARTDDSASTPDRVVDPALGSSAAPGPEERRVTSSRAPQERFLDAAGADEARRRLHEQGLVPIEPDDRIGVMLAPGELVLAVRRSTSLDRRHVRRPDDPGLTGDLYVTSRRLVHLGRSAVVYPLDEIREADIAANQLLLVVGENRGVVIDVDDPCVLRVEIAAARAAARAADRSSPPPSAEGGQPSSR